MFVNGKGALIPVLESVGSDPGAVPGVDKTPPVPPALVTEVQFETGYGPLEVL